MRWIENWIKWQVQKAVISRMKSSQRLATSDIPQGLRLGLTILVWCTRSTPGDEQPQAQVHRPRVQKEAL